MSMVAFQAYIDGGIVQGTVTAPRLDELLEQETQVPVRDASTALLSGGRQQHGDLAFERDDLLLVVASSDTSTPIHAAWHTVALSIGPYRVDCELPTLPGFDPERALARPGGEFLLVRDAKIRLRDEPTGPADDHRWVWVNRYLVDAVRSSLGLLNFFPGAAAEAAAARAITEVPADGAPAVAPDPAPAPST
jgi:hypothetical protein